MKFNKKIYKILAITIVVLLLSSCNATKKEEVDYGEKNITLYFANEEAFLTRYSTQMLDPTPEKAIQQLISGPTSEGLYRTIPEEVKVKDINIVERIAYSDFSKEMKEAMDGNYGTSAASQLLLYSIVNTLALNDEFEIDEVKILVEGKDVELGPFGIIGPQKPNLEIVKD